MGGWDIYTSSTDMEMTAIMMGNITSYSTQGTQQMDRVEGQVSVVAITKEVLSNNHEMSQMSVSHGDSCLSLKLIFLQGDTTRWWYEPPQVTVTLQSSLSLTRPNIYCLDVVHTDANSNVTCYSLIPS